MSVPMPTVDRETRTWREELTETGETLLARVKGLVRQGNVRRVIVKHDGHTLLEVPLTVGVVGVLLAPQAAALGALAALVTECSITVEREERSSDDGERSEP
ncbi:MAG: DUF4342 domain-containing protein [Chloroflexota bacterium]